MHSAPACNEALILKPLIKFLYHRLQTPPQPPPPTTLFFVCLRSILTRVI